MAVQALSEAMQEHLGYKQAMDIAYFAGNGWKVEEIIPGSGGKPSHSIAYSDSSIT